MAAASHAHAEVMGHLASNWPGLNDKTPALVLNAAAGPLDLLAWCWGEAVSLEASAKALARSTAPDALEPAEVGAIYLHRLTPLASMLEAAITALRNAQTQRGSPVGARHGL